MVPSAVRMSTMTSPSPVVTSWAMVGSVVMPASMPPLSMAAMNVWPAPALTVVYSPGSTPARTARARVRKSVDEPGLVTPRLAPAKSDGDSSESAWSVATTSASPGTSANCTTLWMHLSLACRSMVWS